MNYLLFIGGVGGMEVVLILAVVLLLFGGKKIPELMRGVGKGIREFNTARASLKEELEEGMKDSDLKKENSESK
jgi:sec-independent protein translocase protein TatA